MTTIVIQFETDNLYAQGVALMDRDLAAHPLMAQALETIAKEKGFDFVSEFEREVSYADIHKQVDEGGH